MSKDNVKKMFAKLEKDQALMKEYVEIIRSQQALVEKELAEKLISLGNAKGFSFNMQDLIDAKNELIDKTNSNRELAESDLANVAGGNAASKTNFGLASLFTLGLSCAAGGFNSIVAEKENQGSCATRLSLTAQC